MDAQRPLPCSTVAPVSFLLARNVCSDDLTGELSSDGFHRILIATITSVRLGDYKILFKASGFKTTIRCPFILMTLSLTSFRRELFTACLVQPSMHARCC